MRLEIRAHPRLAEGGLVAALVATAFALRVMNYANIVAYPDEFTYLSRALATLGYHWDWSRSYMFDQPPLFMYMLSVITVFVNSQLDTVRLLSVVAGSLTIGFVYFLGKEMFSRRAGLLASLVMAFNGFDILYSRLAQEEAVALLFTTASLYFFWTGVAKRKETKRALAAGVFLGLALDTKYTALLLPATFVLYFLLVGQDWKSFHILKREWWGRLASKEFGLLLAAGALVFAPVLYELQANGVNALYWDVLGKFVNGYSPFYRSFNKPDIIVAALNSYSSTLSFVSNFNPASVFPLYGAYSSLTFFSLVGVLVYFLYGTLRLRNGETFLTLLFGISVLVFLVYPNRYQYYQLYTFPAYPLMFGALLDRAWRRLALGRRVGMDPLRGSALATFLIMFLVLSMGIVAGTSSARSGEGANDQLITFFQYVKANPIPNLAIAVTPVSNLNFVSYYLMKMNISARIVELTGVGSAADPPGVRILEAPIATNGTESVVVTLQPLVVSHPQFVVLEQDEYQNTFTSSMKLWLAQNYQPLMSSPGFLIFERTGTQIAQVAGG